MILRFLSWKLGKNEGTKWKTVWWEGDAEKQKAGPCKVRNYGWRLEAILWDVLTMVSSVKDRETSEKHQEVLELEKSQPATTPAKIFAINTSTSLITRWRSLLCCFSLSGSPCPRQCTYIIFSIHSKIPFCFWNIQFSQPSLLRFCWGHALLQDYNLCSLAESDSSDTVMDKTAESKGNYENLSQNKKLQLTYEGFFLSLSKQS